MVTFISNGGQPLGDCPTTWEEAHSILKEVNSKRDDSGLNYSVWKFDCGFKLDFDGNFVSISSRFYPPKTGYGSSWDGDMCISMTGYSRDFKFDAPTLDELISQVHSKEREVHAALLSALKDMHD